MTTPSIPQLLAVIGRDQGRWELWRDLGRCWAAGAVAGLVLLLVGMVAGWTSAWTFWLLAGVIGGAAFVVWWRHRRSRWDVARVARMVEEENPRLHALLLTAAEQQPDAGTGEFGFLQERVIGEALAHHRQRPWGHRAAERLFLSKVWHGATLIIFLLVLPGLYLRLPPPAALARLVHGGVEVTPGDTILERGATLVVLARFHGKVPAEATLVVAPVQENERRISLVRSLSDPVFGAGVPDVRGDLSYRVEYGGKQTRDFRLTVFDFPKLERADARLQFPEYTRLPEKTIEDTRRVSAVEGTTLDYTFHLNKPVRSAALVGREVPPVELAVDPGRSNVYLATFQLTNNLKYELVLIDDAGRTNKLPPQVLIEVTKNREPDLKFVAPKGDQRVSSLQELRFSGTASDDFGLEAYGLGWNLGGGETHFVELGQRAAPNEKKTLEHLLALETLGVKPDELVSYFLWADDIGPDGQRRRTSSDMFFAEVRPFEEIFREQQSMEGEGGGGGGQAEQAEQLAQLQKEVISATWKLKRQESTTKPSKGFASDAGVVREAQQKAADMVEERLQEVEDPRSRALVADVKTKMEEALKHLETAQEKPSIPALDPALSAEQAAYQALLRLAAREYRVSRGGQRGGGGGGGGMQQQLQQLDLTQAEDRYAMQRQAQAPQQTQAREDLQVFNRLKELAQRQQDLNEQIRELQAALQQADDEQEREEIRRRLKRLREDQDELLADVDELNQRMNRGENQTRMAESREQLDQARGEARRAAQSLESGDASQALSAGTRAERELSQLRDDFRKENSSQFSEAMRELRDEARDLARQEQEIGRKLEALNQDQRKTLSTSEERGELASALDRQGERRNQLVERATEVTQQAESVEPRLSRQLYDTLREASQADPRDLQATAEDLLNRRALLQSVYDTIESGRQENRPAVAVSADLLRSGYSVESSQLEQRARRSLEELRTGVERAAESVLGDDTEALRFARRELDELTRQLEGEGGEQPPEAGPESGRVPGLGPPGTEPGGRTGQARAGRERSGEGEPGEPGEEGTVDPRRPESGQLAQNESPEGREGQGQRGQRGQRGAGGRGGEQAGAETPSGEQAGQQGGQPGGQQGGQQTAQNGGGGQLGGDARGGARRVGRGGLTGGADRLGGGIEGGGPDGWRGPLLGSDYQQWSDRLREVEEALDLPDLREDAARVREEARRLRIEFRRHGREPQWDLVETGIFKPLVELRSKVMEELARRESKDSLVPIDRDPVPARYAELVRRYYEELGKSP